VNLTGTPASRFRQKNIPFAAQFGRPMADDRYEPDSCGKFGQV